VGHAVDQRVGQPAARVHHPLRDRHAALLEEGQYQRAGLYAFGGVFLALVATFCGFILARELIAFRERL
jgi:hypothetical protein